MNYVVFLYLFCLQLMLSIHGQGAEADIPECDNSTLNNCSPDANCTETTGSYTCTCKEGFSGDGVTCEPIKCEPAPFYDGIENCSDLDSEGIVNYGGVCTFTCDDGFRLVGDQQLTCGADGLGEYPSCWDIRCPNLMAPDRSSVDCDDSNYVGSQCNISCDAGYGLEGAAAVTCTVPDPTEEWVEWTPALPTCAAITCPVLLAPDNGPLPVCSSDNNFGSVCSFTCSDGFGIVGTQNLTCGGDGLSINGAYDSAAPTCEATYRTAIALGVLGGVVLITLLIVLLYVLHRKKLCVQDTYTA